MANKKMGDDWFYKYLVGFIDECARMDFLNGVDDMEECSCDKCKGECSCNADDDLDPEMFVLENKILDLMEEHQEEVENCTDVWRKVNDFYKDPTMRITMAGVIAAAEEYTKAMQRYMRHIVTIIENENEKEKK